MSLSVKFLPQVFISNYFIKAFDRQKAYCGCKKNSNYNKTDKGVYS